MKTTHYSAAAFTILSSLSILALQAGASAPQDASARAAGSASVVELRPVKGELVNKLDAKSAKAGDQVIIKTIESVQTANGVEIPKGSRLVGTVTEVQAHGSDSADSHVGIRFDHAELKSGQSVAIHSEIRSLSPPVVAADSMDNANSMGTMGGAGSMGSGGIPMGNPRVGMAGGDPAGGALGGGVGNPSGTAGAIPNTTARTPGTLNSAADDAAQASGGLGGRTSDAGTTVNAGAAGGSVAHATGVQGVMLTGRSSTASSASGTLSSSKKNVHLDGGTQFVLGIAADQP